MDDPLVLAAILAVPVVLGLVLRLKGAVLAALGLAGYAAAVASSQALGAAVLGALGGFALGWAGSLTRRLSRRRER